MEPLSVGSGNNAAIEQSVRDRPCHAVDELSTHFRIPLQLADDCLLGRGRRSAGLFRGQRTAGAVLVLLDQRLSDGIQHGILRRLIQSRGDNG